MLVGVARFLLESVSEDDAEVQTCAAHLEQN